MKKSQSSTEFMIFIGMAIIILMIYFAISHHYLNLTYQQKDVISGQDLAKQIKNEINLASRVEDNYYRTFDLPAKIGNKDFSLTLAGREVVITINDLDYVELLSTHVTEGGTIEYSPGETLVIRKEGGIVYIGDRICNEGERKCGKEEQCAAGTYPCEMVCQNNEWISTLCEYGCEGGYCQESCNMENDQEIRCGTPEECGGILECIVRCNGGLNQWEVIEECIEDEPVCNQENPQCVCFESSEKCGDTPEECEGASSCVMQCQAETWIVITPCTLPDVCTENPFQCLAGGA